MEEKICLIGGTGPFGIGLALRLALAGKKIIIGSRKRERAREKAELINETLKKYTSNRVEGERNDEAVKRSSLCFLTVPYPYHLEAVESVKNCFKKNTVLVSTVAPFVKEKNFFRPVVPREGSAAQEIMKVLPPTVKIASAFQTVSASYLQNLKIRFLEGDVIVCGEKKAKRKVFEIIELIPNLRPIDGGPIENSVIPEAFTALLINLESSLKAKYLGLSVFNFNFTREQLIDFYKEKYGSS